MLFFWHACRVCEALHSDWLFARQHLHSRHLIGPFANVYIDYNYNRPTIHTLTKTLSICRIIHVRVYPVISHISCHLPIVALKKKVSKCYCYWLKQKKSLIKMLLVMKEIICIYLFNLFICLFVNSFIICLIVYSFYFFLSFIYFTDLFYMYFPYNGHMQM
jgi:hypothetical protein